VRADDLEAGAELDQMRTEEQECAQEEVAEPRVVGDDRAQVVGGDLQHAPPFAHDGGEVGDLLGQQVELADDLTRRAHADHPGSYERWLDELDLSLEHDIEVAGELALLEEHLAVVRLPHLPARTEHVDLLVGQRPEGLAGGIAFAVSRHGSVSFTKGESPSAQGEPLRSGGAGRSAPSGGEGGRERRPSCFFTP
jgi:hypothetical protein